MQRLPLHHPYESVSHFLTLTQPCTALFDHMELSMSTPSNQQNDPPKAARDARADLRAFALGLPEAYEEFPWGECVVKVNKKVFVFLGLEPTEEQGLTF